MGKALSDELYAIISDQELTAVFQPIIDFSLPRIIAYEALIRGPKQSAFHSPNALFTRARELDLIAQLEQACLEVSCREFMKYGSPHKLFINMSPYSLVHVDHEKNFLDRIVEHYQLAPQQIVIEISERYPVEDYDGIHREIRNYRDLGFGIAIDDLGSGYSGLRVWSEIRPDFVKVDRHFIQDIHKDPIKREFVRSINQISQSLNCGVIAEGIEDIHELTALRVANITHGQGFLLGRPENRLQTRLVDAIHESNNKSKSHHSFRDTIEGLVDYQQPVDPNCCLETVVEIFRQNSSLLAIPVVREHMPLGLALRHQVLEIFFDRYGRELHAKNPIRKYMYRSPIIVDQKTALESVSKLITGDSGSREHTDFIIVDQGKYIGLGKIQRLLEKLTEQQILYARYANPLTLLPGNVPIYEWLDELLADKTDFHVAYCDLNYFKPFNDTYGYSRGDDIINWLGEVLKNSISEHEDRVGHIGGDDFVIIFQSQNWKQRCKEILTAFEEGIAHFYNPQDLINGGITSQDRAGNESFFPLLSLAIGVVNPDPELCASHHTVAELASNSKHEAKKIGGNSLFISRRRGPTPASVEIEKFGT